MSKRTRRLPEVRKADILDAALILAESEGYAAVTREAIAAQAGISPALVGHYWGTMPQLRRAIMSAAIARHNLAVVAQGLAAQDSKAHAAPLELRQAALGSLL